MSKSERGTEVTSAPERLDISTEVTSAPEKTFNKYSFMLFVSRFNLINCVNFSVAQPIRE